MVRRGPGCTEKWMPTNAVDVIISFLFLGEGGATELATAQSHPFLIGLCVWLYCEEDVAQRGVVQSTHGRVSADRRD